MKIGIIGSGRVGYSMGRYLADNEVEVIGYYDRHEARAADAAAFTQTKSFGGLSQLVKLSDTLFITTQDGEIAKAWDHISQFNLQEKLICHFSGSLSSDVFTGIDQTGAYGVSIHPMLAFSDKYNSYKQLKNAYFTAEGHPKAVAAMKEMFASLGNVVREISAENKALYHCATSVLSNHVVAVLQSGYEMLEKCGFTPEEAMEATSSLVRLNMENVLANGTVEALTGPIERNDIGTVKKHLSQLDEDQKLRYKAMGVKLVEISKQKNPGRDYGEMLEVLK
ncbi:MAG: DUF2520 domain-containing protein [Lachnospiraceae bacterium]|nr:DUF2520 domain-containing protein [Lachnospiraceae bacterium]